MSFFDINEAQTAFNTLHEQQKKLQVAYLYGYVGSGAGLPAICESSESNKSDKSEDSSDSEKKPPTLPGSLSPEEVQAHASLEQKVVELVQEYDEKPVISSPHTVEPSEKRAGSREAKGGETKERPAKDHQRLPKPCPLSISNSARRLLETPLPRYNERVPRGLHSPRTRAPYPAPSESQTCLNQTCNCSENSLDDEGLNERYSLHDYL